MRTPSLPRVFAVCLVSALSCMMIFGCTSSKAGDNDVSKPVPDNDSVNLPPTPDLPLLDVPQKYEDGTLSVIGLLAHRDAHMLDNLVVSGKVVEIYHCDKKDENKGSNDDQGNYMPIPGCEYPHFFIADTANSPKRLLVTLTGMQAAYYEPKIQEGTLYRFKGYYTDSVANFSSSQTGLLSLDSITGSGIVPPDQNKDDNTADN